MSFSAEIKDFIGGFQAGASVGGDIQDRKLNREKWEWDKAFEEKKFDFTKSKYADDKDYRERAFEESKKRTASAEGRAERNLKLREERARNAGLEALGTDPDARGSGQPGYSDYYVDEKDEQDEFDTSEAEISAIPVPEVSEEDPLTSYQRRGGMVLHAAEGALVPQVEDEEHPELAEEESRPRPAAIPVDAAPAPSGEPEAEQEVASDGKGDMLVEQVKPIIKEVFDASAEEEKAEASRKPEAIETEKPKKDQSRVRVATGEGAATPEEIKAIDQKIDPNGELEPWVKGAARLYYTYNYFVEQGQPEKARNVAKRIIAYDKMASQALGHLAQTALEQNDLVSASRLVTDAYNENIPDGNKMTAQPTAKGTVLYKIERNGKVVQQGEADTRQIWEMAGKIANGSEYIRRMGRIAGEARGSSEGGSAPQGKVKRSYPDTVRDAARAVVEVEALQKAMEDSTVSEEQLAELRKQYTEKRAVAEKLMERAERVRAGTNRPRDVFEADFMKAKKNAKGMELPAALPEAPKEEPGWFSGWFGGDEEAAPAAPQSAIPDAAPVTSAGKPLPPEQRALAEKAIANRQNRQMIIERLQKAGYNTEGL